MQKMLENVNNLEDNDFRFINKTIKQFYKIFISSNLNNKVRTTTKNNVYFLKQINYIFIFFNVKLKYYKNIKLKKTRVVHPLYKISLNLFSFVDFDKLLKNTSSTFHNIKTNLLVSCFGFVSFKFSRTNRFFSIANSKGEILNSYSCGIFKNVKRLKHKRNFFLVKIMISFVVYKLKQCNFNQLVFKTRLVNMSSIFILNTITSLLLKKYNNFYKKKNFFFYKKNKLNNVLFNYFLKKLITRNGIKKRKLKRR